MVLSAQVTLNEMNQFEDVTKVGGVNTVTRPQFVEFYNAFSISENLDCYTLLTYHKGASANDYYFYVIKFNSSASVPGTGFFTVSRDNLSTVSSIQKYQHNSTGPSAGYTISTVNPSTVPSDFLLEKSNSTINTLLFFYKKRLVDVFGAKQTVAEASTEMRDKQSLTIESPCGSLSSFNVDFFEIADAFTSRNVSQASGNTSFSRECNGGCFSWVKTTGTYGVTPNSTNTALCTATPLTSTSWSVKSMTYKLNSVNTTEDCLSTNINSIRTIPAGDAYVYSNGLPIAARVTVTFENFSSNLLNAELIAEVYTDNSFPQGLNDEDNLYSITPFISPATTTGQVSIDLLLPITNDGRSLTSIINITTAPGMGSCNNSSPLMYVNTYIAPLPVSLGNISLKTINNTNKLNWSTASESNNKGFEVQRSIGNTNDFKTIGFVGTRAKDGNSQTEISYSFEDTDVKPGQTHFYRLNQIDFDGKSAFSPVKSIKPGSIESNLNVYPNPSQGSFTVNTGSTSGKLNIFVMDNTGRVVNQYMNVSTTNTKISNLKKGFYTLKIVNTESGEQSAQRVVVQ